MLYTYTKDQEEILAHMSDYIFENLSICADEGACDFLCKFCENYLKIKLCIYDDRIELDGVCVLCYIEDINDNEEYLQALRYLLCIIINMANYDIWDRNPDNIDSEDEITVEDEIEDLSFLIKKMYFYYSQNIKRVATIVDTNDSFVDVKIGTMKYTFDLSPEEKYVNLDNEHLQRQISDFLIHQENIKSFDILLSIWDAY